MYKEKNERKGMRKKKKTLDIKSADEKKNITFIIIK